MVNSRRSLGSVYRWFLGLIIILAAVGAFIAYQSASENNTVVEGITPTAHGTYTQTQLPTTAVAPTKYLISAASINMLANIIPLYYAHNDGWDLTLLNQSAGHLQGTSDIGRGGNFVLAGHVELEDGSQGAFAKINSLKVGDEINIIGNNPQKPVVIDYKVTEIKLVSPTALNEIRDHGYEEMTLVTCQDWDPKGRVYNKRLIVHARPIK